MKAKSMVLIMVALGCGLVASIGISQVMVKGEAEAPKVATQKVLVAMDMIDIAAPLTAENVKLEEWPKELVREGAITSMEEIENKYSKARVVKGMPILQDMLVDENAALNLTIPDGYRVTSMKVSIDEALSGLLQPGDRVDITGYFRLRTKDGKETSVAKTFLTNVQVFAVNEKTERIIDPEGKALMAKTVSMLVTPKQVKKLLVAKQSGHLHMSLRSDKDETALKDEELVSIDDIILDPSQRGSQPRKPEPKEEPKGDLKSWLDRMAGPGLPPGNLLAHKKVMLVHTPGGIKEYRFSDDPNTPPEVVEYGAGSSPPPSFTPPTPNPGGQASGGTPKPDKQPSSGDNDQNSDAGPDRDDEE